MRIRRNIRLTLAALSFSSAMLLVSLLLIFLESFFNHVMDTRLHEQKS